MDRSTDSSVKEKQLNYGFFRLQKNPSVKFLGIEKVKFAHADRLKAEIFEAFDGLKLTKVMKNFSH